MARRNSRGRSFRHGGRRYQWFGFQNSAVIVNDAAVDNFIIVPTTAGISEVGIATLVRTIIQVTISYEVLTRLNDDSIVGCLQRTETTEAGTPVGILDPVTLNAFGLGNADILGWWQIPVPPAVPPVSATQTAFRQSTFESKAKRKMKTRMHAITFAMSGFANNNTRASVLIRCLMQY